MKTTLMLKLMCVRLRDANPDDTGNGGTPPDNNPETPPVGGEGGETTPPAEGGEVGSLWDDPTPPPANDEDGEPPSNDGGEWSADYGEMAFANDAQKDAINVLGKELGIDGKAYGTLINRLNDMIGEQNAALATQMREETTTALKASWGAEYETKSAQARGAFNGLAKDIGMTPQQLAEQLPATPAAFQLLQKYAQVMSGSGASINGQSKSNSYAVGENGLPDFVSDPSSPDYADYHNPSSDRYKHLRSIVDKYCGT